ncbi:ThuA domain-containing protein [Fundicoccus culcitae]|uniref:ThuA domain-containing protein n=1 Tax=Fundicoccus culcitae TaxID=2969821 RepID=A0ABY5P580_9LACT|nr:ThuA domain-containing protein [Fundicoccus culcitae]UUX33902.1 ThuA domain-containing protein [Fundicoccus culcitae]
MIRVTVWNEFRHETTDAEVKAVYPEGIHQQIASFLSEDFEVKTATLDEAEHGLTEEVLNATDVLIWWGHMAHDEVADEIVDRVQQRVLAGMGLIVLHSGHFSKIFQRLMGTSCNLKWREDGKHTRLWNVNPSHPIAAGVGEYFEIEQEEMYGEHFDIPAPDELVFVSWFPGGEVFRSGCTFRRGQGKIFYFQPGHETYPTYYQPMVQKVIRNAIHWANPTEQECVYYGHYQALEQ